MGLFDDPTGLIALSFIAAAISAVPISRAILASYRRRITDLMRAGGTPIPEKLLDTVGRRWRHVGSIQLIAAPDVAAATLDPAELLEFVSGRLDRAFIKDTQSLEARIEDLDLDADADGTYRVTEFYCRDDAWRITLQRLARDAGAVLMDLRGFGPDNAGCIYEIGQLLDLVPTGCTVLIVDDSTDQAFLEVTLREA